jgi:integrase
MSRIGALKPTNVETPHGSVRVLSKYRADKRCYRLVVYGTVQAVQWMLPNRTVATRAAGMAQVEVSHPDQLITNVAALNQFCRELVARWEERLELGVEDPALALLNGNSAAVVTNAVPTTFGALVDRYIAVHMAHLRRRSMVGYKHILDRWISYLGRHTLITAISADNIRLGMAAISTERSSATANAALRVLKIVLNYAVNEGYLNTLPHRRVGKLPAPPRAPTWWSKADAAKVLASAQADKNSPRDAHLLFAIALYLGLRKGEIDRLCWEDLVLDGERPICSVRSTSTQLTKSGKARHIPVCKELRAILLPYRQPNGHVLRSTNSKGKWVYRFECDALFARVMKAAGVPKIRFHDMRHTFCSLMLEAGVPMFKVSQWLGHSDIRITQETYAHLAPYDQEVDLLTIGGPIDQDQVSYPASYPDPAQPSSEAPQPAPQPPGEQATPTEQR